MGLVKAAFGAAGGVLADQWKEFFYCESIDVNMLVVKGKKREDPRSSNTKGTDNIISDGSIVAVADGQAMMIVEQGKIVEFCAEPGEFKYDASTEPSIFNGKLGEGIKKTFANIGKRFEFGGQASKDQRVYYFNLKEIVSNKYGTPNPIPFRVIDKNIGLDVDIAIRCNGEYSYKLTDPLLFYTNVCGNVDFAYHRDQIDGMLKSELLTALQPAFAKISNMGVRYSSLPGHTLELADALNEILSKKWAESRGLAISSFGVNSVTAPPEDENMIKELQRTAVMRNAGMAGATIVTAQADAMKTAAGNPNGAMMGFVGMNAAMNTGSNAGAFFDIDEQNKMQSAQAAPQSDGWKCECGELSKGKFCNECGKPRPIVERWKCECGEVNKGKFCIECGQPKPTDNSWKCECGEVNKGKFCNECGKPKP
ncbi:SPFH domain-containing protein [Alkalibaculum sp. M08DMB]|uniref:SPFH domain-containing protein n=1 Tax=Alkalibaculum sporogenes TaxID=2655001 RepID=A0A6A7KDE0_9FIRM|nr:SPFH domain-containing protein [Alkalibaculum sporogenes]MPW27346.1 SPFH domain-containing protein [Alkalibaculum sporogenes]